MLRPAAALGAIAMLATASPAAPAHDGKVVRVERRTHRGLGTPRYCEFSGTTLNVGSCLGHAVEVGELVTIVTPTAVIGQLRVERVTPDTSCGAPSMWVVEGEFSGDATLATGNELMLGVVDGGLDPRRARAMPLDVSPSGRQTDAEYFAFDGDGDGTVDLAFDHYMCDAQGTPSQAMTAQCFEAWASPARGREMRRLRLDIVPQC